MKPETHSINDVLAKNVTSFFIPPFQRSFAWGKPEIERYFSDIIRIITSELDESEHDKLEHFFGTIVMKVEDDGFASRSVVVDGQQRLTTTLLFLIALRDQEPDEEKREAITKLYLKNDNSTFEDKIKLKQVTRDWESYRVLVNHETPLQGIISNAYHLFSKLISETKKIKPQIQMEHYIKAIKRMNVAVLFLDNRPFKGEDPQIIFETLNSLGKPLSLSDLVRNFVLLNMDSTNQSDVYEKIWNPKIENILHENTSKFFRDYLQYKIAGSIKAVSDNNTKELYQLFKDFVNKNFTTHTDFIEDIVPYVNWYYWIITEIISDTISSNSVKNKEIIELLRNIFHDIKSEAFKPFVLGLLKYHQNRLIDDERLISTLTNIRTYLIRRRILGLTQGENKEIPLLCDSIEKIANGDVLMIELLSNLFFRLRFPNDSEMENVLKEKNFYRGLSSYSKFILGKMEEYISKVAVDFRDNRITIEHIMPQKLNSAWHEVLGSDYETTHKTYLDNIGNLILTEFNTEMGNKPFVDKMAKLRTSSLSYRLDIIDKTTWDKESIISHREEMISRLLKTFPLPEAYKSEDNWNTSVYESNMLSPLDNEATEIAEGNKPINLRINGKSEKIKTWQDVIIRFIHFFYKNQMSNFDFIVDNQFELFRKDDTIIKWASLKLQIEDNIELSKRYKTFDNIHWDRVDDLTDDIYFIHTNISASTCINRMSIIMNKLNLPTDFVQITLREAEKDTND